MNIKKNSGCHGEHIKNERPEKNAASESALNDLLYLTLWIHGTAGETDKPCGEVDIVEFTGERIKTDFIEWIMNADGNDLVEALKGLPTEDWLKVKVYPICEEGEWWLEVKDHYVLPPSFEQI